MSTELAWCAGFYDGEGCASISCTLGRSYARVSIGQNKRESLDRFRAAVGVGCVYGPYEHHMFHYQVNGAEHVRLVFDLIEPWLGSSKREQFKRVLSNAQPPRVVVTYCLRGHDVSVLGRNSSGTCRKCHSEDTTARNRVLYAERQVVGLTAQGKPRKYPAKSHTVRF